MAIGDDFEITPAGDIRHVSGTARYTVLELHRWIGSLLDDARFSGDAFLDITSPTASRRSTDQIITLLSPYNIDDATAEFLYDGSIIQNGGDTIYDGIICFAPAGTYLQIVQNGSLLTPNFWTTGINAEPATGISHRFLVKVRAGGVDIDGRRLLGQTREFGKTYSEFQINGTVRGNNVIALQFADDLNNPSDASVVATWSEIVNSEGYQLLDVADDGTPEPYYSEWQLGGRTIAQFYERAKWLTRRGTAETVYGIDGALFRGVTHEIDLTTPRTGTFDPVEAISWPGGSGLLLAVDSPTAATKLWLQLLTGTAPSASAVITGASSLATATMTGSALTRPVVLPFCGPASDGALIGAYGVGIRPLDLSSRDVLRDLTNTTQNPPNVVTFTVHGLVATEDRVLVGPEDSGALDDTQLSLDVALTGAAETAVIVTAPIPNTTPPAGTLRIRLDSGAYRRVAYTSWTGSTFTIVSTDFSAAGADIGNDAYVSYIDRVATSPSESYQVVFTSEQGLYVRVRSTSTPPIKTFQAVATLGAAGGSITITRTPDN